MHGKSTDDALVLVIQAAERGVCELRDGRGGVAARG